MQLIRCLLSNFYLSMFRGENKIVCYCMRCSAWVCRLRLAVVLWSCVVSRVHCVKVTVYTVHKAHDTAPQDHSLVGSLSSPYVHDAQSQEPKTYR